MEDEKICHINTQCMCIYDYAVFLWCKREKKSFFFQDREEKSQLVERDCLALSEK